MDQNFTKIWYQNRCHHKLVKTWSNILCSGRTINLCRRKLLTGKCWTRTGKMLNNKQATVIFRKQGLIWAGHQLVKSDALWLFKTESAFKSMTPLTCRTSTRQPGWISSWCKAATIQNAFHHHNNMYCGRILK